MELLKHFGIVVELCFGFESELPLLFLFQGPAAFLCEELHNGVPVPGLPHNILLPAWQGGLRHPLQLHCRGGAATEE